MKFSELELRKFGATASLIFGLSISEILHEHEMKTADLLTDVPESKVWLGSIRYEIRKQARINKDNGTTTIEDLKAMDIDRHLQTMPTEESHVKHNRTAIHYIVRSGRMYCVTEANKRPIKTPLADGIYKLETRFQQYVKIA